MKKGKVLDKGMIEDFAQKVSDDSARKVFYLISEYVDEIATSLFQTNPLLNVQNIELLMAGDLLTGTFLSISEPEFYLSVRSAQIEINSVGPMENKFKIMWKRFKSAWATRDKNTKRYQKKEKKKALKKGSEITEKQLLEKKEKPYSLLDFKNDFFEGLVQNMTNMTVLYNTPSKIRILARDEFGFRININPVIKHDDYYKVWNSSSNKFIEVSLEKAKKLLEDKTAEISKLNSVEFNDLDLLYKIIRIFKNLYYNLCHSYNYQFVESLIYFCPSSLFKVEEEENYIYNVFLKVLNYLNNVSLADVRSIYNQEASLFKQHNISIFQIKGFLKDIKNYLE